MNGKNIYKYDDVFKASLTYFNNDELAAKVFVDKYALKNQGGNGEWIYHELTPADMHKRLAGEFYRMESKYSNAMSEQEIFDLFDKFKYVVPQGSPMSVIGNPFVVSSISNCVVLPSPLDSYGGICYTDQQIVQMSKRRCGIGFDISNLRPKGMSVKNSALTTDGIGVFMERFSNSIREVGQSGRRGAQLMSISVHHPEVLNFATIKNDLKKVTGANISIFLTDEFLQAVESNKKYEQRWPVDSKNPKYSKMVDAKQVWNEIIKNAWNMAEPGLMFIDKIKDYTPPSSYEGWQPISSNPSLRGETLVLTKDGIFPIKYLSENKSKNLVKNMHGEWSKCDIFKSGENKQLFEIEFTNGQKVYCTKEHKWPIVSHSGKNIKIIKRETINLKRKNRIIFPFIKNIFKDDFKNVFNKEDGFRVGWLLGDGWISFHKFAKKDQYSFVFSKEDMKSGIGERIINFTNSIAKIKSNLRKDHGSDNCYTFCTTDSNVDKYFKQFEIEPNKTKLPLSIFKSGNEFIKGLIDGLFSSDGSIYVDKRGIPHSSITLTSSRQGLLEDTRKILSFYGIRSYINKRPNRKSNFNDKTYVGFDLKVTGMEIIKFSKIFSFSNINKQKRIEKILTFKNEYKNKKEFLTIKKVKATNIYEDVYDITVHDDTHTFMMETGITGNCSEITMNEDTCRLIAINMSSFVDNPFTKKASFNFEKWKDVIYKSQRLMDDMVDLEIECMEKIIKKIEQDSEPQYVKQIELDTWKLYLKHAEEGRRTGLGVTGVGDTIAYLNLKYGSKESIKMIDEIFKMKKYSEYKSSIDMAEQRGCFKFYDFEKEKSNEFIVQLFKDFPELQNRMKQFGRRNIAISTVAPTGSLSILTMTTAGIEPVFQTVYKRRKKITSNDQETRIDFVDQLGDKWQEFSVYHHGLKKWMEISGENDINKSPYFGSSSYDLNYEERISIQSAAQKHIDHSISSTLNLPSNATVDDVALVYWEAWKKNLKGVTVYRDGCRSGVLITDETPKEKSKFSNGNNATKRPQKLPCDIYKVTADTEKWVVLIGMLDGKPYEIFCGKPKKVELGKTEKGYIEKEARGIYSLHIGEDTILKDISDIFSDTQGAITRLLSTSLRHGVDIQFLVQQLEKSDGSLTSFNKALSRVLKKYIKDGTKESGVKCDGCNQENTLIRQDGCITCNSCGWSKCQ